MVGENTHPFMLAFLCLVTVKWTENNSAVQYIKVLYCMIVLHSLLLLSYCSTSVIIPASTVSSLPHLFFFLPNVKVDRQCQGDWKR